MTHYDLGSELLREGNTYLWQLRFLEGAHRILEVGCSTGFFSRHLVARGHRVVGFEQDAAAAAQARAVCAAVIEGDIECAADQARLEGQFDAVLLGDVLEHLREPGRLLTQIRERWLAPGGRVVLSVPNAGHWIFRREVLLGRFPYRKSGLFDRTHLRFFTRASLRGLVAASGYSVEREAITVNRNSHDDLTFASLAWLYRNRLDFRSMMIGLEGRLARLRPTLFAYQFVLCIRPCR